jgi:subtilisin family serine protease
MTELDGQPGGFGLPSVSPCSVELNNDQPIADDTAVFFSNFATTADDFPHTVAAPGVCGGTTAPDDNYSGGSGTSFSSPIVAGTVALCIAAGPCAGLTPQQIIQKIVSDAAAYNQANPGYGFAGDPLRPIGGKYYGWLVRAGLY